MKARAFRYGILSGALSFGIFAQTAVGQSTNQPFLQIFKMGTDVPAALSWSSKTNEVYTILYSTNLTAGFLPAVTDFPNQGTNTIWSDWGSESSLGSRPSSVDVEAPIRFYRLAVQGYTSNSFPATITFSNATDGTVLSGLTNVFASAVSPSNLISGILSVDGNEVSFDSGGSYDFPLETRSYPNGTHRLSITVEDNGDSGTTGGDDPSGPPQGGDSSASYAAENISVVFSNFLSDVWLKYQGYRPELSETQEIHATWASARNWQVNITPANDTNTIYRAFGGSGTSIVVLWDGLDSGGNQLAPQRVAYVIEDLGAAPQSGFSPISTSQNVETEDSLPPPEPPLPWDTNYWSNGTETTTETPPPQSRSTATRDSATDNTLLTTTSFQASANNFSPDGSSGSDPSPFVIFSTYKTFGTFGMLYQGDHPYFSPANRPQRGAPFGQVTFSSSFQPPWGKLKAAKRIASDLAVRFPISGYPADTSSGGFIYGDDNFKTAALQKTSLGGSNILNNVTIGLYVGHSAACKENIVALGHPQSYIPVYDSVANTMSWVGMYDMDLGSSHLKWMAFYSCNLFRDDVYRANGVYTLMKNNFHLAMNSSLHIMQAYATEMTVRHDMGQFWVVALIGSTSFSSDNSVLGAWRFVCLQTQPIESPANANVSRSAYWPECAGDHIYGYGSQTDPSPDNTQDGLLEDDQMANTTP